MQSSNDRKITRMARILTIFGPKKSQRCKLFDEKFLNERNERKLSKVPELSISKLPKNASDASGHGAPWPLAGRSFSLEVASFAPTYKFSEAPEALRARFFARLGRFGAQTCSPEPPWDAPGLDFRVQNNSFFDVFPFDEHSARKTSNIKKTL